MRGYTPLHTRVLNHGAPELAAVTLFTEEIKGVRSLPRVHVGSGGTLGSLLTPRPSHRCSPSGVREAAQLPEVGVEGCFANSRRWLRMEDRTESKEVVFTKTSYCRTDSDLRESGKHCAELACVS